MKDSDATDQLRKGRYHASLPSLERERLSKLSEDTFLKLSGDLVRSVEEHDREAFSTQCIHLLDFMQTVPFIPIHQRVHLVLYVFKGIKAFSDLPLIDLADSFRFISALMKELKIIDISNEHTVQLSTVPWRMLYDLILPLTLDEYTVSPLKQRNGASCYAEFRNRLYTVILQLRPFFPAQVIDFMVETHFPLLNIFTVESFQSLFLFSTFAPLSDASQCSKWFDLISKTVQWSDNCHESLAVTLDLFGRLSRFCTDKDSFNWTPLILTLAHRYILSVGAFPDSNSSHLHVKRWPSSLRKMLPKGDELSKMTARGLAALFAYHIESEPVQVILGHMLESIAPYFHPLKNGKWTAPLSAFIEALSHTFAVRIGDLLRLSLPTDSALFAFSLLIPQLLRILSTAFHSSSRVLRDASHRALRALGELYPSQVLLPTAQSLMAELEGPHETRTHKALEALGEILDLVSDPELVSDSDLLVSAVMWKSVEMLEPSKPLKSLMVLWLQCVVFSTRIVADESFIVVLMERLLDFISHLDAHEKSNFMDRIGLFAISKLFQRIRTSVPHSLLDRIRVLLMQFARQLDAPVALKYIGVVFRYFGCKSLCENVLQWVESSSQSHWKVYLLSQTVREMNSDLLPLLSRLKPLIVANLTEGDMKMRKMTRKLLRNVISSLLSSKIVNALEGKQIWVPEDSTDLQVDWTTPSVSQLKAASDFIEEMLQSFTVTDTLEEQIIRNILTVKHLVKGFASAIVYLPTEDSTLQFKSHSEYCLNYVKNALDYVKGENALPFTLSSQILLLLLPIRPKGISDLDRWVNSSQRRFLLRKTLQSSLSAECQSQYNARRSFVPSLSVSDDFEKCLSVLLEKVTDPSVLKEFERNVTAILHRKPKLFHCIFWHAIGVLKDGFSGYDRVLAALSLLKGSGIVRRSCHRREHFIPLVEVFLDGNIHTDDRTQIALHNAFVAVSQWIFFPPSSPYTVESAERLMEGFRRRDEEQDALLAVKLHQSVTGECHWRYQLFSLFILSLLPRSLLDQTQLSSIPMKDALYVRKAVLSVLLPVSTPTVIESIDSASLEQYHQSTRGLELGFVSVSNFPSYTSVSLGWNLLPFQLTEMQSDAVKLTDDSLLNSTISAWVSSHSESTSGDKGPGPQLVGLFSGSPQLTIQRLILPVSGYDYSRTLFLRRFDSKSVEIAFISHAASEDRDSVQVAVELFAAISNPSSNAVDAFIRLLLSCPGDLFSLLEHSLIDFLSQKDPRDVLVHYLVNALLDGTCGGVQATSRCLKMLRLVALRCIWRLDIELKQKLMDTALAFASSDSHPVRQSAGKLFVLLLRCFVYVSNGFDREKNSLHSMEAFSVFANRAKECDRTLETLSHAVIASVQLLEAFIVWEFVGLAVPPLLSAVEHSNPEISALCKQSLRLALKCSINKTQLVSLIDDLCVHSFQHSSGTIELLKLLQEVATAHYIAISEFSWTKLLKRVLLELKSDTLEVRSQATVCLSSLLTVAGSQIDKEKLHRKSLKAIRTGDGLGGALTLCAMVLSEPFDVPEWMPEIVASVASLCFNDSSEITKLTKQTISEFKRTHKDAWHVFEERFSYEQLSSLSAVDTAPSYFA